MSMAAARKIVEDLEANIVEDEIGSPHFSDTSVRVFPLTKDSFHSIKAGGSQRRHAFVDGGNQEIIGAPNFSVQLSRVYASVWQGRERVNFALPRIEFFSATFSAFKDGEIFYETLIEPAALEFTKFVPDGKDVSFNSFDRTLMDGIQRADIGRVASIGRRFAEWKFASLLVESLQSGDVLVMDGTLQTTFTNESKYLQGLVEVAKDRGVILTGLSKTSTLFTTTGLSLLGGINKLGEDSGVTGEWYCPIAESTTKDHDVVILVVKLNGLSERVFRYEIQRDQFTRLADGKLDEILFGLVKNSSDPTFPGYPYGLIDADRLARVSTDELEYYRGLILSQISGIGKWSKFSRHIRATDAHSILNMLMG